MLKSIRDATCENMSIGLFSRAVWSGTTLTATYGFISGQKDVDAQAGHKQRR